MHVSGQRSLGTGQPMRCLRGRGIDGIGCGFGREAPPTSAIRYVHTIRYMHWPRGIHSLRYVHNTLSVQMLLAHRPILVFKQEYLHQ